MHSGNLAPSRLGGIVKSKLSDPPRLHSGDNLQTLDNTGDTLKIVKTENYKKVTKKSLLVKD